MCISFFILVHSCLCLLKHTILYSIRVSAHEYRITYNIALTGIYLIMGWDSVAFVYVMIHS